MATKVDTFVTLAESELTQIRQRMEALAADAQALSNRWSALGKLNMTGWTDYTWDNKPYTASELAAALNGLELVVDTADGVKLTNAHTACKAIDRIVKASL
jgi:hypothetical protein